MGRICPAAALLCQLNRFVFLYLVSADIVILLKGKKRLNATVQPLGLSVRKLT
jgi:hypothetical protein